MLKSQGKFPKILVFPISSVTKLKWIQYYMNNPVQGSHNVFRYNENLFRKLNSDAMELKKT